LASLQSDRVAQAMARAVHAAKVRANELGDEFGR
jgi:hypothetical protein